MVGWLYRLICEIYEDKKIENWNNEYVAQFIDPMYSRVSSLSYTSNTKTIMQVLRFYCDYADCTFCYSYVGRSFRCNHACDYFCCNYAVRSFCMQHLCKWQFLHRICGWQFLLYLCRWVSLLQLCRWYFLQCTTVSVVKCRLMFLL